MQECVRYSGMLLQHSYVGPREVMIHVHERLLHGTIFSQTTWTVVTVKLCTTVISGCGPETARRGNWTPVKDPFGRLLRRTAGGKPFLLYFWRGIVFLFYFRPLGFLWLYFQPTFPFIVVTFHTLLHIFLYLLTFSLMWGFIFCQFLDCRPD